MRLLVTLLLCTLLAGCDLGDDRDLCCYQGGMTYRLTYDGYDYFPERVGHLRCFLFSGDDGRFLRELPTMPGRPERVDLSGLEEGYYGMIAVGNLDDYGEIDGLAETVQNLRFGATDFFRETRALSHGDQLYWGAKRFHMVAGEANEYVTELSNIHCHLKVMVEWEGLPPGGGNYYLQLSGVYDGYNFFPGDAWYLGERLFPEYNGELRSAVEESSLLSMSLQAEFVTLRYTNEKIPSIRVWHGSCAETDLIDLKPVFRQWGWYPDTTPAQEYELHMLIYRDGSVKLSPSLDVGVNDWTDGGAFE